MEPSIKEKGVSQPLSRLSDENLAILYRQFAGPLLEYGGSLTPDSTFVEDAIQDIFLTLLQRDCQLLVFSNIRSYLFVALRNYIRKHSYVRSKKLQYEAEYLGRQILLEEEYSEPIALGADSGLRQRFEQELGKLPPRQRETLSLKFIGGYDYEEIAQILNIPYQVARNYAYRGMKKLREQMAAARVSKSQVAVPTPLQVSTSGSKKKRNPEGYKQIFHGNSGMESVSDRAARGAFG